MDRIVDATTSFVANISSQPYFDASIIPITIIEKAVLQFPMVVIGYDVIGMVEKIPKMFFRYNKMLTEISCCQMKR